MKASHEAYARAQAEYIAAQEAMAAATDKLRAAEDAVRPELEATWNANQADLQAANAAVPAAMARRLEVEDAVAAVCSRERRRPTDEESSRCWDAREQWVAAKEQVTVAQEKVKAGVTPAQLAAAEGSA